MLVADASAVIAACLGEAGWDMFAGQELTAPYLALSEASSVLHEGRWRGDIAPAVADEALRRLQSAPLKLTSPGLLHEAWAVADRLGWAKTYDAEYVALAMQLGCRLVTLDERLRRGVRDLVEVVSPAEL